MKQLDEEWRINRTLDVNASGRCDAPATGFWTARIPLLPPNPWAFCSPAAVWATLSSRISGGQVTRGGHGRPPSAIRRCQIHQNTLKILVISQFPKLFLFFQFLSTSLLLLAVIKSQKWMYILAAHSQHDSSPNPQPRQCSVLPHNTAA